MASFEILIEINPAKRTEFLQAFEMIKSNDSYSRDRSDIALFEQVSGENTFLWTEHWQNYERLEQYFEGNTFHMMLGAIKVLGRMVDQKVCRFEEETDNGN